MISAILVGVTSFVFLCCYSCYFVSRRIDESTWKARQDHLQIEQEQRGGGGEICSVTRGTSSSSYSPEEAQRKKIWPLIKLKDEKGFVTEVIAMWSAFFAYSLVDATGSTFFFEQMKNMDSLIGSIEVLPSYFTRALCAYLVDFSSFLISFLYNLLIPKHWRKATGTLTLVRIGCGLACSMLSCVAAWQVEGKRLKAISNKGLEDDNSKGHLLCILQFVLLGVMERLALNGLTDFLVDRIANNDALRATYYASHISDLILGVGKLITASTIILFRRSWFHHNINGSRC
ncbi:unnamed protein product [Prunus brigantina]